MEPTTRIVQGEPGRAMEIRFSRYLPEWRLDDGSWPPGTWTHIADCRADRELLIDYERVEDCLVDASLLCLGADNAKRIAIHHLELGDSVGLEEEVPAGFRDGVTVEDCGRLLRLALREEMWCEFVGPTARCAVGHEMYVHAQLWLPDESLLGHLRGMGLHVEDWPYQW